jgi:hypothetical protein
VKESVSWIPYAPEGATGIEEEEREEAFKATKIILFFVLYVDINSEIKIPRPLSQATAYNHRNICTFTSLSSAG